MAKTVLWQAVVVQALAVAILFGTLVALPLPSGFFRANGAWLGPVSWLGSSLITALALRLSVVVGLAAASASGLFALAVSIVAGHTAGLVIGVITFGVLCAVLAAASRGRRSTTGDGRAVSRTAE